MNKTGNNLTKSTSCILKNSFSNTFNQDILLP